MADGDAGVVLLADEAGEDGVVDDGVAGPDADDGVAGPDADDDDALLEVLGDVLVEVLLADDGEALDDAGVLAALVTLVGLVGGLDVAAVESFLPQAVRLVARVSVANRATVRCVVRCFMDPP